MKKFWIGFGESPTFSRKDRAVFLVMPADGNRDQRLTQEHFVEAADMAEAREKLKAVIDKYFEHDEHMSMLEDVHRGRGARLAEERRKCAETTSLTIGDAPGKKPNQNPSGDQGLFGAI